MTEITLDREQAPMVVSSAFLKGTSILLMVLALIMSVWMLHWVVVDKLEKFEQCFEEF